jgi:hypothetical protein
VGASLPQKTTIRKMLVDHVPITFERCCPATRTDLRGACHWVDLSSPVGEPCLVHPTLPRGTLPGVPIPAEYGTWVRHVGTACGYGTWVRHVGTARGYGTCVLDRWLGGSLDGRAVSALACTRVDSGYWVVGIEEKPRIILFCRRHRW